MEHYTIILHTRLNRKVFSAGNISRRLIEIIEDIPTEHTGIYLQWQNMIPCVQCIPWLKKITCF